MVIQIWTIVKFKWQYMVFIFEKFHNKSKNNGVKYWLANYSHGLTLAHGLCFCCVFSFSFFFLSQPCSFATGLSWMLPTATAKPRSYDREHVACTARTNDFSDPEQKKFADPWTGWLDRNLSYKIWLICKLIYFRRTDKINQKSVNRNHGDWK